jgi:uncharacterized protein YdhG (YjbR/CyaY superfamily)
MSKLDFQSVDDYISSKPEAVAAVLELVRLTIRKALPKAEETISYKMPAYKSHGELILYFAGWKQHYSLYPADPHMVAAFKDELTFCKVDKGTIRFPLSAPAPKKLIAEIARFRLAQVAERKKKSANQERKRETRAANQMRTEKS